nr:hypothetical protein [uncultured Devosia sp.]
MITNLPTLALVVGAYFGAFIIALGYGQWQTRNIEVYRAEKP